MLGVGNWDVIEDSWDGIPVNSYLPLGKKEWGERSYRHTADIVKFFSEYTGYRYPWSSYLQVAVEDFIYGGMENTGAVVYFDGSVYDDKTEPDYNATGLVAHELAHQWWGDAVTCKNWNEIWLNESFATYFQCLYSEHLYGKDEFDYNIFRNGNSAITVDSTTARKPIYTREGLGTNTYDKGSVVLNMMRYYVGDEKFRRAMNIYITKNQHKPVVTKNLLDALHEAIDMGFLKAKETDMKWFFKEWIYNAGQPEIEAGYVFDESAKEISLTARQIQRLDSSSIFKTPFPFQIITAGSKRDFRMETGIEPKSYKIKLDSKPLCVIFNKGNKVLCKLQFTKPMQDWLYQLRNSDDAIDRITAIRGLKDFIDNDSAVNAIAEVMTSDKFWGARYEAAQMLSNSTNKIVQEIYLKKLVEESDSRVRRSYITGIAKLVEINPELKENKSVIEFFLINLINNETSYYAVAEGISTLAKIMDKDKVYDVVVPYLSKDSHAEIIRRNVMAALDTCNDPRTMDIFMEYGEKGSTSRLRNTAIRGLYAFLDDPKVIDFLNRKVLEKPRSTQGVILDLLEKAHNSSSKPFLEELTARTNDVIFKERVSKLLQTFN
jgi:aminopeptidase N